MLRRILSGQYQSFDIFMRCEARNCSYLTILCDELRWPAQTVQLVAEFAVKFSH